MLALLIEGLDIKLCRAALAQSDASPSDVDVAAAVFAAFEAGEASLTDVLDSLRAGEAERLACCARVSGPVTLTTSYW